MKYWLDLVFKLDFVESGEKKKDEYSTLKQKSVNMLANNGSLSLDSGLLRTLSKIAMFAITQQNFVIRKIHFCYAA